MIGREQFEKQHVIMMARRGKLRKQEGAAMNGQPIVHRQYMIWL